MLRLMVSKKLIRVALLVGLIGLLGLKPEGQAALDLIRQGDAYKRHKEYSAAIEAYWLAAALRPRSAVLPLRVGEVYVLQERYALAVGAFEMALRTGRRFHPAEIEARLGLAAAYTGLGEDEKAVDFLNQVLTLEPENLEARYRLGRAYLARSELGAARREFEGLLAQAEMDPRAHYQLGLLLAEEDPDRALRHLEVAAAGPQAALAGEAQDMISTVKRVMREENKAQADAILGAAYLNRREWSLARREFEEAIRLKPDHADAHAYLGRVLEEMGESEAALSHLWKAVQLDPKHALGYYFLGMYHRAHGRPLTARGQFTRLLELDPDNAAACVEVARTYIDKRDYPTAREWFHKAVELEPEKAEFHLLLADFHLDFLFKPEEGLAAARKAVELAPENAVAHDTLGWAYYLRGQRFEAERSLKKALALDPDLPSIHYHLGTLYAWRGVEKRALYEYQRAIDLDSEGFYRGRAEEAIRELKRGR